MYTLMSGAPIGLGLDTLKGMYVQYVCMYVCMYVQYVFNNLFCVGLRWRLK